MTDKQRDALIWRALKKIGCQYHIARRERAIFEAGRVAGLKEAARLKYPTRLTPTEPGNEWEMGYDVGHDDHAEACANAARDAAKEARSATR